jgi:molybdate transport system permease protein
MGPLLARLGIQLPFTAGAVVLAQIFVAVPFFLRPAVSAFRGTDAAFAEAAELDGAGPLSILWWVELPLSLRALGAAATLAWARALGEFGATILFAGSRLGVTRTMPLAIYLGFETDLSQATALSCLLLGVAVLALLLGLVWGRSKDR